MKFFETSGHWSLSHDPANVLSGTLVFDNEGLNLKLLGSFATAWQSGVERYPIVHGIVGKNPYGTYVTLIDCINKASSFDFAGVNTVTLKCNRAVIGSSHLSNELSAYKTMELGLSFLRDWVGVSGIDFKVSGDLNYTVNYNRPEVVTFTYGNQQLSISCGVRAKHSKYRVTLEEQALLYIEPVGERQPTQLAGHEIQNLQNLLTFATDRPNAIENITYYMKAEAQEVPSNYHFIFDPVFRIKGDKERLHESDMLFTFRDIQSLGVNIFQRWLEFTERNQGFCTIYFANLYAEPRFLNDRFATLMLAFTLLARMQSEVSLQTRLFVEDLNAALKERFSEVDRECLIHVIPTDAELGVSQRLRHLLQENAELLGTTVDEIPEVVKSISRALAYFKRRGKGDVPIEAKQLLNTMMKVQLLLKIIVLKELGFTDDAMRAVVTRNTRNNYTRMSDWKVPS